MTSGHPTPDAAAEADDAADAAERRPSRAGRIALLVVAGLAVVVVAIVAFSLGRLSTLAEKGGNARPPTCMVPGKVGTCQAGETFRYGMCRSDVSFSGGDRSQVAPVVDVVGMFAPERGEQRRRIVPPILKV